eukprot:Selendium_serpulae@DN898_c0_g1_i1.p1
MTIIDESSLLDFVKSFQCVNNGTVVVEDLLSLAQPAVLSGLLAEISNHHFTTQTEFKGCIKELDEYLEQQYGELQPLLARPLPTSDKAKRDALLIVGEMLIVAAVECEATDSETQEIFIELIMSLVAESQSKIQSVIQHYSQGGGEDPGEPLRRNSIDSARSSRRYSALLRYESGEYNNRRGGDRSAPAVDPDKVEELSGEIASLKRKNEVLEKDVRDRDVKIRNLHKKLESGTQQMDEDI